VSGNAVKLTGTKLACDEGGCGSCTVLISKFHRATASIVYVRRFCFPLFSVIRHLIFFQFLCLYHPILWATKGVMFLTCPPITCEHGHADVPLRNCSLMGMMSEAFRD